VLDELRLDVNRLKQEAIEHGLDISIHEVRMYVDSS